MDNLQLKAEVLRIIRANQDKPAREISKVIRECLPDVPLEDIGKILGELADT